MALLSNAEIFSKIPWSDEHLCILSPSENWPREGVKLPASALTSQHFDKYAVPTEDLQAFKGFIEAIPSPEFDFFVYPVILQSYAEIEQCKETLIQTPGNKIIVIVKTIILFPMEKRVLSICPSPGAQSPLCLCVGTMSIALAPPRLYCICAASYLP